MQLLERYLNTLTDEVTLCTQILTGKTSQKIQFLLFYLPVGKGAETMPQNFRNYSSMRIKHVENTDLCHHYRESGLPTPIALHLFWFNHQVIIKEWDNSSLRDVLLHCRLTDTK